MIVILPIDREFCHSKQSVWDTLIERFPNKLADIVGYFFMWSQDDQSFAEEVVRALMEMAEYPEDNDLSQYNVDLTMSLIDKTGFVFFLEAFHEAHSKLWQPYLNLTQMDEYSFIYRKREDVVTLRLPRYATL